MLISKQSGIKNRGWEGYYRKNQWNLIHFQLGVSLTTLGVIIFLVAQHISSLPAYAFIA